jgi:hypothetical protein
VTAYDHDELKTMLASYAIGALPEDEMPRIRDHILTCEECMEEADRFAAVAPVLALTTPPDPLPTGFADAVVAKVRAMEPVPATTPKGRRSLFPRLVFGATVLAAIVLGGALVDARNDARQAERSLAALEQRVERNEQALSSLVRHDDGWRLEGSGGAVGRMVPNDGGATLAVAGLPSAPEGHIYQLWLLSDSCGDAPCAPTSAGLFEVTSGVVLVEVDRSIGSFAGAAVTLEPAGGSALPTTDPLLASV